MSTFAAAMPVGAHAFAFLPWTMHQRYTVVRRKDFPVPADAWPISRSGTPERSEFTMCVYTRH